MQSVLILITNPREPVLTPDAADTAAAALPSPGTPVWLADGIACEVAFTLPDGTEFSEIENTVCQAIGQAPIDVAALPADGRRKALLVADMDSTMIGEECIDELGVLTGLGVEIAAITERAMRGELNFAGAVRERVGLMKGLDASAIDRVISERISYTPGGRELVQTMRAHNAFTALVSGGFTSFTAHVASQIGFEDNQGNRLVIEDGRLAGTIEEAGTRPCRQGRGAEALLCGTKVSRRMRRWRSATARTIWTCWAPPAWELPSMPNRSSRSRRVCALTMAT